MGELDTEVTDLRSRSIRVRHVLAMASGHTAETIDEVRAIDPVDIVRGFLLLPPEQEPGSVFAHNQPCTFTAAAIVQRVSGDSLVDYLRPRLLDPLGIGEVAWQRDASGREIGYSGLHATTEAAAALGQLYVQEGRWGDRQLLSPEWVREASRAHIDTHEDGGPDWQAGYGFQFWRSAFGYRADGASGQFSLIVPELELVVALTGQTTQTQTLLSLAWEHLLPAVGRGSTSEADARLVDRLAALALPPLEGASPATGSYTPAAGSSWLSAVEVSAEAGGWTCCSSKRRTGCTLNSRRRDERSPRSGRRNHCTTGRSGSCARRGEERATGCAPERSNREGHSVALEAPDRAAIAAFESGAVQRDPRTFDADTECAAGDICDWPDVRVEFHFRPGGPLRPRGGALDSAGNRAAADRIVAAGSAVIPDFVGRVVDPK
ncbi:hypothetical protein ACVLV4_001638 [Rathayibacter agropyri]